MDAEAEQADAERPHVGLVQILEEGYDLRDQPAGIGREPEQLGQLTDEDHDGEAREVPGSDRVRQEVGDEPEPGDAAPTVTRPDQQGEHSGEADRDLLVTEGKWQDRGRDHGTERGIGTEDEDRRRSDEGDRR